MFIVTLFIIVEKWEEFKCPSTDIWIQNVLYPLNGQEKGMKYIYM